MQNFTIHHVSEMEYKPTPTPKIGYGILYDDLGGLRSVVAIEAFVRLSDSFISYTASSIGTQIRSLS
ncbi:hypothetical protein LXL04_016075 [Taraxacum kok-saghyz]